MVAFDGSERCGEAEAYFHDCLDDEGCLPVPSAVIDHIQRCRRCRERLAALKELLGEVVKPAPAASVRDKRLTGELQSHFECLDEPVSCSRVKPFLPKLLDPSIKIRIPTPITAHLDHCAACVNDLESLREFELDSEHLARLSSFYAHCAGGSAEDAARVRGNARRIRPAVSESMGARALARLAALSNGGRSGASASDAVSCEDISWSDIFDCVVLLDLKADESGRMCQRETCRIHVASCSACLDKVRALSRTVSAIAERPDSEVVTVCSVVPETAPAFDRMEASYSGYPLDVKVLDRRAASPPGDSDGPRVVPFRRSRRRPFFKVAGLIAAMIPLAILFFVNNPTEATGVTVAQVRKVLAQAERIHVAEYNGDMGKLLQEVWASRTAGIHILWTADQPAKDVPFGADGRPKATHVSGRPEVHAVFDLKKGRDWTIVGDQVTEGNYDLTPERYSSAEERIDRLLEIYPQRGRENSELRQVVDPAQEALGIEVYELVGENSAAELRLYIEVAENRLCRLERLRWDSDQKAPVVTRTQIISYPEAGEVQDRLEQLVSSPPLN